MHTVSFVWNDYAWLLTAPSGTGKTTQYLNWQRLYPGEITMICGDMTVLEHRESGSIWVHSSSWNGKENIGSYGLSAPLAGIVFLAQGPVNFIEVLSPRDAVVPLIQQFMMRPDSETEILLLSRLVGQILQAVPVWKMTNLGNDDSTEILRNTLAIRMKELTGGASHDL